MVTCHKPNKSKFAIRGILIIESMLSKSVMGCVQTDNVDYLKACEIRPKKQSINYLTSSLQSEPLDIKKCVTI